MTARKKLDPTILVIFGGTGELSRQRLMPALFHLFSRNLLPKIFFVIGFARSGYSHQKFREIVRPADTGGIWPKFAKKIFYLSANFGNSMDFRRLLSEIQSMENRGHSCANRLFYFATLPSHYQTISHELKNSGLLKGCQIHKRQTRVIIEKPFGEDLKSARKLDRVLHQYFSEPQIYRIDHYLGKETVQNLFTARFANSIFEPIWNKNFIDHVQISALEERGIENRGAYYEKAGALRDVVQNHLMQLLALTAMDRPADLTTSSIRDERVKIIKALKVKKSDDFLAAGQYRGYRQEPHVNSRSLTETYAALKVFVQTPRFAGVPFYLRTGKKLKNKITQISIHFKTPSPLLFPKSEIKPDVLTFQIQPNEGISLKFLAKYPGFGIRLHPVAMELGYTAAFRDEIPEAYERLLLDFLEGDQRLFARSDEIEHSWKFIDFLEKYRGMRRRKIEIYEEGAWGPKSADKLIAADKRKWNIS